MYLQIKTTIFIKNYCLVISMDSFVLRLDNAKKALDESDYILIGAGAGLSSAAGILYGGERFTSNFQDFIEKYAMKDMYSSGFYPFKTSEEKWAYWARHIDVNRYSVGKTDVYQKLLNLVKDKDYFVLTTNVEHQFWINDFEDERIFATQGDYGLFQCSKACQEFNWNVHTFPGAVPTKTEDVDFDWKLKDEEFKSRPKEEPEIAFSPTPPAERWSVLEVEEEQRRIQAEKEAAEEKSRKVAEMIKQREEERRLDEEIEQKAKIAADVREAAERREREAAEV